MIFQPSDRVWRNASTEGMRDVWIDHHNGVPLADQAAASTPDAIRLHALWMEGPSAQSPVLLYLHGARWNVTGSTPRMRRMNALGFAVLAVDYQGFGQSSKGLPSEASARADALAAWRWLAQRYPQRPRFIFGHSLGGAIGIDLATQVDDEQGVLVENTFTSIVDMARTFKWGWLPVGPFVTQRFETLNKVAQVGAPLVVVHGDADQLVPYAMGQELFARAGEPKRWIAVPGGTHHNTNGLAQVQYQQTLQTLWPQWWPATVPSTQQAGTADAQSSHTATR